MIEVVCKIEVRDDLLVLSFADGSEYGITAEDAWDLAIDVAKGAAEIERRKKAAMS